MPALDQYQNRGPSLRLISHNMAAFRANCVKFTEATPTLSETGM